MKAGAMIRHIWTCVPLIAAFAVAASAIAGPSKDVPSWVQELSSRSTPPYTGKVPAAVLLSEEHVTVDASGLVITHTRAAIKILTHEGQREATAEEYYFNGGRRVTQLHAWLVAPDGFIKTYDKNAVMDIGAFGEMELYNDIRIRRIKAENPEIGAVFAYESEVEEKSLFAQDDYLFQTNLPAVQSRYSLTLPAGWTASAVVFNHEPIQPVVDGTTYTWELKELPFREHEDHSPSMRGLAPRLAVDFHPPADTPQTKATCFRSWTDVSQWHTQLAGGQDEVTPEIAAKVHELTTNAATEYAKIQAIGRYVQAIKYVAIEMDESHGGGYKPHAAGAVFRKQYGDCKDKANLMRAMLKAAGIESYLVAIFSGDRTYVREEWASPHQFNHMILAVRVSDAMQAPTVVTSAAGRLLLFDPTSETTPMGDLPWYEQGSRALLCAGSQGTLLKVPVIKPEANLVDITVEGTLSGAGNLSASLSSRRTGQSADMQRSLHFYSTADEFRADLERTLARTVKAASISNLDVQDSFDENTFRVKLNFASQDYGQLMQQRLLVFSPSVLEPPGPNFSHNLKRAEPIILRAAVYRKHTRVKLPPGFTVDEMPEAAKIDSDFARFTLTFRQEADELIVEEELTTEGVTLPAEQYLQVKKFFDQVDGADQQRAVLVKTGS
jgi:transglutaminase-like putative cysteine protease